MTKGGGGVLWDLTIRQTDFCRMSCISQRLSAQVASVSSCRRLLYRLTNTHLIVKETQKVTHRLKRPVCFITSNRGRFCLSVFATFCLDHFFYSWLFQSFFMWNSCYASLWVFSRRETQSIILPFPAPHLFHDGRLFTLSSSVSARNGHKYFWMDEIVLFPQLQACHHSLFFSRSTNPVPFTHTYSFIYHALKFILLK